MIQIGKEISLTIEDVTGVVDGEKVEVDQSTLKLLGDRRKQITDYISNTEQPAYGFNRGFGSNVDVAISSDDLEKLQLNYTRSHSCGVGEDTPRQVVRAVMLLRAHSLSLGHSAVRPEVVEALVGLLNADIAPVVPLYGSVGASGDLCPLSHIALCLIGEGQAKVGDNDKAITASQALEEAGLKPLVLKMKEGLALNNGIQFSTAYGVLCYHEIKKLLKTAALNTSISAQVMLGSDTPFLSELHELRPHKGAQVVSKWIWDLMQNSPIRELHRNYEVDGEVQDPYNLRCAGQILGTCYDLLEEARATFEVEMNSVTDNPILLENPAKAGEFTSIISCGHFHGMPVAVKLYNLQQALAIMCSLSNVRCSRYIDPARNKGLESDIIWPGLDQNTKNTSSGMMIPEYVSAALTNDIWGASMPSHLMTISTCAGQEDHVSMSAGLAVRIWETIPKLAAALAIELGFGAQAAAVRKETDLLPFSLELSEEQQRSISKNKSELLKVIKEVINNDQAEPEIHFRFKHNMPPENRMLSSVCEEVLNFVAEIFPVVKEDRELSRELKLLTSKVKDGSILKIVEATIPLTAG